MELKEQDKDQHPRLNIETNIRECLAFRTKLYSNLGLNYEVCDFGNAGSDYFPESTAQLNNYNAKVELKNNKKKPHHSMWLFLYIII